VRKPKFEPGAVRQSLIAAAEQMLEETGGRRLVMSELASRVGLTQSHAHSYFATKDDLVRALAARWFEGVETALQRSVADVNGAEQKLRRYVLTMLRVKREKFDANPELFRAYLALASEHGDVVHEHARALREVLEGVVAGLVAPAEVDSVVQLVEDATVLFRVPHMIAMLRASATDERAEAVVDAVLAALHARPSR
jgi:AcrR family transcriptional regulator